MKSVEKKRALRLGLMLILILILVGCSRCAHVQLYENLVYFDLTVAVHGNGSVKIIVYEEGNFDHYTITINSIDKVSLPGGALIVLVAIEKDAKNEFRYWVIDGKKNGEDTSYTIESLSEDRQLIAVFHTQGEGDTEL